MKNLLLITVAFLCLKSNAQKQPFPANVVFNNGLMPSAKNSQDAKTNYDTWKTNFVEGCSNGRYRVKFDSFLKFAFYILENQHKNDVLFLNNNPKKLKLKYLHKTLWLQYPLH